MINYREYVLTVCRSEESYRNDGYSLADHINNCSLNIAETIRISLIVFLKVTTEKVTFVFEYRKKVPAKMALHLLSLSKRLKNRIFVRLVRCV